MPPSAAPTPCRHPGCRELVVRGYCDQHRKLSHQQHKQSVQEDYKERNRFYQRAAWKQLRAAHLRFEPLCRQCASDGRLVAAEVVDHIIEISDGGAALDDTNLQSLCKSCHNSKTIRLSRRRR